MRVFSDNAGASCPTAQLLKRNSVAMQYFMVVSLMGFVIRIQSNAHSKCRSLPRCALHLDVSAVRVGDPLRDGESQPNAAHLPRAHFIGAIKSLENARQILGCNADPGVPDFDDAESIHAVHPDRHAAAGR